jgi:hypothetical protein
MKYNQNIKYNNQFISYYGEIAEDSFEYVDYSNSSSVQYSTLSSFDSDSEVYFDQTVSGSEGEIEISYSS